MTVAEVNGYGRQKGHTEIYRGSEYVSGQMPKLRLDIAVSDERLEQAVEAIQVSARTGQIGDWKILTNCLSAPCACAPAKATTRRSEDASAGHRRENWRDSAVRWHKGRMFQDADSPPGAGEAPGGRRGRSGLRRLCALAVLPVEMPLLRF